MASPRSHSDDPALAPESQAHNENAYDVEEDDEALVPADGYFRGSGNVHASSYAPPAEPQWHSDFTDAESAASQAGGYGEATSSNVPHVPDVWVADPSLAQGSTAESKAREAREEQEQHEQQQQQAAAASRRLQPPITPTPATASAVQPSSPPSSQHTRTQSASSGHIHQEYAPSAARSSHSRHVSAPGSETTPLFITHYDAPPAYTPSPTSPDTRSGTGISSLSQQSPLSSTSSPTQPRSYQTFTPLTPLQIPEMGNEAAERQRLLARDPESMGGPHDGGESVRPVWKDRVKRRWCGINWVRIELAIVLLLVFGAVFLKIISSMGGQSSNDNPQFDSPKTPVDSNPGMDNDVPLGYPALDNDLVFSDPRRCGAVVHRAVEARSLEFTPRESVIFVQGNSDKDHEGDHPVHVEGEVIIRRSGDGTPRPSIVIEVANNGNEIEVYSNWDRNLQKWEMLTARTAPHNGVGEQPCVALRVTIWVPSDAALSSLDIDTVHLGIKLLDNLALSVGSQARFTSVVGRIIAGTDGERSVNDVVKKGPLENFKLDSRHVEVTTTSSSIQGHWPLYDYLGIKSISGTVDVSVAPKEVLKKSPEAAVLQIHTTSGSVKVSEPIESARRLYQPDLLHDKNLSKPREFPIRDYKVDILSQSGTVNAAVAFSSVCKIHTTSGSMHLSLVPMLDKNLLDKGASGKHVELETATTSGTTQLDLGEPLWVDIGETFVRLPPPSEEKPKTPGLDYPTFPIGGNDPYKRVPSEKNDLTTADQLLPENKDTSRSRFLRVLSSRHSSISASITAHYPSAWEGQIQAQSMSGSLQIIGEGVEIIKRDDTYPPRSVIAKKGPDGGSSAFVKTVSGTVFVNISK